MRPERADLGLSLPDCSLEGFNEVPDLAGLHGLPLTNLEWCCERNCSDAWLAGLAALGLPLAKLTLDRCGIRGPGLAMFLSLTSLCVRDCDYLSAAGLAAVAGLPMLRELDIITCDGITPAGLQELRAAVNLESFSLQFSNTVRLHEVI